MRHVHILSTSSIVCIDVCMHGSVMYLCVCVHVCIYARLNDRLFACMHVCMFVCVYDMSARACIDMHVCMCVCVYACMCVCVCVFVWIILYAYMYVCVCVHRYVCMHVSMYARKLSCTHACMYICVHVYACTVTPQHSPCVFFGHFALICPVPLHTKHTAKFSPPFSSGFGHLFKLWPACPVLYTHIHTARDNHEISRARTKSPQTNIQPACIGLRACINKVCIAGAVPQLKHINFGRLAPLSPGAMFGFLGQCTMLCPRCLQHKQI